MKLINNISKNVRNKALSEAFNISLKTSACVFLLAACSDYQVTLNERPIYQPPSLLKDFTVEDESLRECIAQHILDEKITEASQLRRLVCSYAAVASLEGLALFNQLQQLNLSDNALTSLSGIEALTELKQLSVKNNKLIDVNALRGLDNLEQLNLSENPTLPCDNLTKIVDALPETMEVALPVHCGN